MKNFKRALTVALALIMVLSFAACGSTTSGSDSETATYVVGTEPTFPPFDTTDDSGDIVGFDMDLIAAIGEDQGFEVEFSNLQFDALIPALQSGNIDIIAAGMNCDDEERQAQVDFSDPYYESGLVVAVAADDTTINSVDDLTPDMKVAAQIGTTGENYANELAEAGKIKEVVVLNGLDTAMLQLINGDVSAVINDLPVTKSYIEKQPDAIKIVGDVMNAERYGIAVQKGNTELLDKINAGLKNIKENGKYDEIYKNWLSEE